MYFLKRKGYELLLRESDIPQELIGPFKEAHTNTRWSPQMYHRLHTVDLMIAAETAVRERANLSVVATFLEYRRVRVGNRYQRETTDLVADENVSENRIIPDAALIIENIETGRRALFFIEMDMGTERIVTRITSDKRHTIHHKIGQYDRYLHSGRYAQNFRAFGDFSFFTLSAGSDRLLTR